MHLFKIIIIIEQFQRTDEWGEGNNKTQAFFQNGANASLKLNFIIYWQSRWQEIK